MGDGTFPWEVRQSHRTVKTSKWVHTEPGTQKISDLGAKESYN